MESPPTSNLLAVASEIGQRYPLRPMGGIIPQDLRSGNQPLPWTTSLTDIWPVVLRLHRPFDIMLLSTLPFRFEVRCCVSYVLSVAPSSDGKPSRASLGARTLCLFIVRRRIPHPTPLAQHRSRQPQRCLISAHSTSICASWPAAPFAWYWRA